jgi:hypothetical protein
MKHFLRVASLLALSWASSACLGGASTSTGAFLECTTNTDGTSACTPTDTPDPTNLPPGTCVDSDDNDNGQPDQPGAGDDNDGDGQDNASDTDDDGDGTPDSADDDADGDQVPDDIDCDHGSDDGNGDGGSEQESGDDAGSGSGTDTGSDG